MLYVHYIGVRGALVCFSMVGALGFEPRIGRLKVCCDNRFTILPYDPYLIDLLCQPGSYGIPGDTKVYLPSCLSPC